MYLGNILQILRETYKVTNWSTLPLLLGISEEDKSRIMTDNHSAKDQHQAFIKAWLQKGEASWAILTSALRDPLVDQGDCANAIAKKYPS